MAFSEEFMLKAIDLAKKSMDMGEAPIGAVIVKNGCIIGEGINCREGENKITGHAEIMAIENAEKHLSDWRLDGCDLYVTLEPCTMCAGAIIQSRIKNIYFGAFDKEAGAISKFPSMFHISNAGHDIGIFGSIMEKECASLLSEFFNKLRKDK